MSFEIEIALYKELLPSWLPENEGKWTLIKGRECLGVFDSNDEAWMAGYHRFGFVSFLLRPISWREPVYHATYAPCRTGDGRLYLRERISYTTYRNALTGETIPDAR